MEASKRSQSILTIHLNDLNLSELNLDGTHTLAKKGGQSVAPRRKKGKTSNILNRFMVARRTLPVLSPSTVLTIPRRLKQLQKAVTYFTNRSTSDWTTHIGPTVISNADIGYH